MAHLPSMTPSRIQPKCSLVPAWLAQDGLQKAIELDLHRTSMVNSCAAPSELNSVVPAWFNPCRNRTGDVQGAV